MANILPSTTVIGSLQWIYPSPVAQGISNSKLLMTKVEGSIFVIYVRTPPYHGSYTAWADYISGSVSGIFEF